MRVASVCLRPPVEADFSVWQVLRLVVGVVDAAVVAWAEEAAGVDVGVFDVGPGGVVVGVAQARWCFAAGCGAASVAYAHGDWHGLVVESAFVADVEGLALPVSDDGDDAGGAGEASCLGCGDAAAGVQGADRDGEEIARIILVNICPCRAGIRKRPWQVPSSPSNIVNVVRRSALASSASSAFPSNLSAWSGAITSKVRPPRMRSALTSWCSASATRWVSAAPRCSVSTASSPVVGSRSRAATIARAWAVLTVPSALAPLGPSYWSNAWARRRSERASRRT